MTTLDHAAHPLVAQLFGDFFTGDDFNEQANVSVFVRAPNSGPVLVPRCWGFVPEDSFGRFVSCVSALLDAGYVVSVDSRVRAGNDVMVYFDLDALDAEPRSAPEPGRISEILGAAVLFFLRAKDKQNKSNLYCAVTRNASNALSFHVYFFNVWCDNLGALKTLGNEVKERTAVALAALGLKLDCGPYAMGSCRWPYTYSFGSHSVAQDTRHKVLGVFSGPKALAANSAYVQNRSPFDGEVFVGSGYEQPVFPRALSALRLFRPSPGAHGRAVSMAYFGRSVGPGPEIMDLSQEDSQDAVGGVPDSSVDVDIDMTDTTTLLDPNELRSLVQRENLGREVANYLRVRVCNIGTDALLKMSDGRGGIALYRYSFSKLVNGGLSIDGFTASALAAARGGFGRRPKQPKAESVWKWWQRKSKFYSSLDCFPFFPGKRVVVPGVINLWSGFLAYKYLDEPWFNEISFDELVREEDCDLDFFIWYLHQVLCNKSSGMFYRFMYFIRQLLLHPELPASFVPIFEGGGGIGKSSLLEWLREYVFGRNHCMVTDNLERLITGYNNFADRVIVALIDEGGSLTDAGLQRVKYASTAFERAVEKKFQDTTTTTCPLSITISCNTVKIALEQSERRFVGNTCDPAYAAGVASPSMRLLINRFYTILHDKTHAEKLARSFVCLLMRFLDPAPFVAMRSEPFVSPLYVKMLRHGASVVERFIVECLETRSNMPSSYRFEWGVVDFVLRQGNWGTYYPYLALTQHFKNFSDFTRISGSRASTLREFLTEQIGCVIADGPAAHVWIRWPDFDVVMRKLSSIRVSFVDVAQMEYYGLPAFSVDAVGQLSSDNPTEWTNLQYFIRPKKSDGAPAPGPVASSSSSAFAELGVGKRPEQFFGGAPKKIRRRYDAEDEQSSDSDSDNDVRRDYMGEDGDSEESVGIACGDDY